MQQIRDMASWVVSLFVVQSKHVPLGRAMASDVWRWIVVVNEAVAASPVNTVETEEIYG
jgi:folate-dependent tRNA-U54 methylase TrmFO/GidA